MKKVYAVADEVPEGSRDYITPGKMYLVDESKAARGFYFTDDLGRTVFATWEHSGHLGGGGWRRVEKDDTTIEGVEPGEHSAAADSIDATLEERGVKKYDAGKTPLLQGCIRRFPLALQQIALVSNYGRRKYGTLDGWEKLPNALNRYGDAGARHDSLVASEGEYDINNSGLPHRAQKAWNALAELELALREGVVQLTPGNEIEDGKPVLGSNGVKK